MNQESIKNVYDDGNIPDSDLPERSRSLNGQNRSDSDTKTGYGSKEQNGFHYHTDKTSGNDPDSSPEQAPLTWVTPPVLLAKTDDLESNAPGIL